VVAREVARGVARRVEGVEMEVAVKTEGEILEAAVEVPVAMVADLVAAQAGKAVGEGLMLSCRIECHSFRSSFRGVSGEPM
jgi:hypothetical protein